MIKNIFFFLLFMICPLVKAQFTLKGVVVDQMDQPIPEVNIFEKDTNNGTSSDFEGRFEIKLEKTPTVLVLLHIGFKTHREIIDKRVDELKIKLLDGEELEEVQLLGSRNSRRSITTSAVPIDLIDISKESTQTGQIELNQFLEYTAPSFNATKQSGADGSDHIEPASLRGLGADQTLVLVNGKRRHQSALINVFGTRSRGNTGTDLNAIPASAIQLVEILRDGASAQYGSDAIAGVINLQLQEQTKGFTANFFTGLYNAKAPSKYDIVSSGLDGNTYSFNSNYGVKIKDKGFMNFTFDFLSSDYTNRPANPIIYDMPREKFGNSKLETSSFWVNTEIPLLANTDLYVFGGYNYKNSDAYAWTREVDGANNIPQIYPNGYNPIIGTHILDKSLSFGIRSKLNDWNVDINNTFGSNTLEYKVKNTLNASLEKRSPTVFYAGMNSLYQNTTSIDFNRYYDNVLSGLNIAFGSEYRIENYQIGPGEESSYTMYDVYGLPVNKETPYEDLVKDPEGEIRPGGSQGFPGFAPSNQVNEFRNNLALYFDTELNVIEKWMVSGAFRLEHYSDFGETLIGKLATSYQVSDNLTLRGSASSGFRAPSLAQKYYNTTYTEFESGIPKEIIIAKNDSPISKAFGIETLKEEKAFNASLGFSLNLGQFFATIDGYFVSIKDRIVLSGEFEATDLGYFVDYAKFFANAIDTKTKGLDIVLNYKQPVESANLIFSFISNLNHMTLGSIKVSEALKGKEKIFFSDREKYFLLASAPKSKMGFNVDYQREKWNTRINFTRFGKVELLDWDSQLDIYEPKITTDLSIGIQLDKSLRWIIGSDNIFNIYPTQQDTETESGGLWDSVQMGFSGAFYYTRLQFVF